MKSFGGKVLFLDRSDINTDEIIPARYLTEITKAALKPYLLEDLKMDGFDPRTDITGKRVVLTRENFGCGSSREHAPLCLKTAGVSCVIAETFARIFYRNAINIGLPIIECPEAAKAIEAGDEVEIDFDSGKIYDRTKGTEFQGQPFPEFMQKLIAAGGLVKYTNSKRK